MIKPNLFIVGAPKCGTTALYRYLNEHPDICIPMKEPAYFASDFLQNRPFYIKDQEAYLALFQQCPATSLAVGEATTLYLYSSVALENIYNFNKEARIIAMLRNPVDIVYAFHSQLVYDLDENEVDFEKAWQLQAARRGERELPQKYLGISDRSSDILQYERIGRLGEQVERLLAIFPSEQVKLILFEDFVAKTRMVYEDVLNFLQVSSDGRVDFPKVNAAQEFKSRRLAGFLRSVSKLSVIVQLKKLLDTNSLGIGWTLSRLNTRSGRPPLSPALRAELVEVFYDDINKLAQILGRDLSHWLA
jgi:hypothetical protein